jgi:hypothetical protein
VHNGEPKGEDIQTTRNAASHNNPQTTADLIKTAVLISNFLLRIHAQALFLVANSSKDNLLPEPLDDLKQAAMFVVL